MKIAYVATSDHTDVGNWSGLIHYIYKSLESQGFDITPVGPLPKYSGPRKYWLRAKIFYYNRLLRRKLGFFSPDRDHHIAKTAGRLIAEKLAKSHYDLVVSPGAPAVAYLDTKARIVIWADATFHSLATTYPEYKDLTRGYYRDGESLELAALSRASLCLFSSEWAARSAIDHYKIKPAKVHVVPFGANVDDAPLETEIKVAIERREHDRIRLLFVGVDFARKGGPKVLEVLAELIRLGALADMRIVGCNPQVPNELKPYTQVLGFISKATAEGRRVIADLFLSSHWLILLPSAECYGLVFAEANCFGVPCIATRVGGIPTIIKDNHNGRLFDTSSSALEIAQCILAVSRQPNRYAEMAICSIKEYKNRLNWQIAGRTFAALANVSEHEGKNSSRKTTIPSA